MAEKLEILLIENEDSWVAQGLQQDIAAQGKSAEEALSHFAKVLFEETAICESSGMPIPPAPQWYWDKFEQSDIRVCTKEDSKSRN